LFVLTPYSRRYPGVCWLPPRRLIVIDCIDGGHAFSAFLGDFRRCGSPDIKLYIAENVVVAVLGIRSINQIGRSERLAPEGGAHELDAVIARPFGRPSK
jgi:hypothetical protein